MILAKTGTEDIGNLEFKPRRSNSHYGFLDGEGLYNYIRLFAIENTDACPFASYLRHNFSANSSCASSATIRTKHTPKNTALAMDITLLRGKSYTLHLLTGMMSCSQPLDILGEVDEDKVSASCATNITELS